MAMDAGGAAEAVREVEAAGGSAAPPPITDPFLTVDGFLGGDEAGALRRHFEAHFAEPHGHRPETHQVWNYWHVPELYTYLRTSPERVIPQPLVQAFHQRLTQWSRERLGLGRVTWPNLSLYVDGCVQHLHNDSVNGRFGFVYSLTPDDRRGLGGETIVLREGDLFRNHVRRAGAGAAMQALIAPRFDRLTIFDDRMPHGVRRVEGGMDPLDGRVVLHGHISEERPRISGPLAARDLWEAVWEIADSELASRPGAAEDCHGPLTLRLFVRPDGAIAAVRPLVDRVVRAGGGDARPIVEAILARVAGLRFPAMADASEATLPIMIGGPLPWMEDERRRRAVQERPAAIVASGPAAAPSAEDLARRAAAVAAVSEWLSRTPGVSRIPKDRIEAYVVADFLAPEECRALIDGLPLGEQVAARIDALTGIDPACAEPLEGVEIDDEGREARFDFFDTDAPDWAPEAARGGQRTWTATLFLDRPQSGGQMLFPNAALRLTPAPGYLLLWSNLAASGEPNGFTVHETLPVEQGLHRLLVRRYREAPFIG